MSSLVRILPISVAVSFVAYTIRKNWLNMTQYNSFGNCVTHDFSLEKRDEQQHANAVDLQNNTSLY